MNPHNIQHNNTKVFDQNAVYSIGLMSGTSMDGIEAALVYTNGTPDCIQPIEHYSLAYPTVLKLLLKGTEYAVRRSDGDLNCAREDFSVLLEVYLRSILRLSEIQIKNFWHEAKKLLQFEIISLDTVIQFSVKQHFEAISQLLLKAKRFTKEIKLIGYHGQAMYHQPARKISVILGDGQMLADLVKIPVINDFRRQDVLSGGQGAPFAPVYHQALAIRDQAIPCVVVNCGGIANVTIVSDEQPESLLAFDTGPGNGLIDQFVREHTNGQMAMDKDGMFASKGKVDLNVLTALYQESITKDGINYFTMQPPKSLDYGDLQLIPALNLLSIEDGCRTLAAFTAESIIQSVITLNISVPTNWILAGGGWHNPIILHELKTRLTAKMGSGLMIRTASEAGWSTDGMEAELFAYLAVRSLRQLPLSYPKTTGVAKPMTGGIYHSPNLAT